MEEHEMERILHEGRQNYCQLVLASVYLRINDKPTHEDLIAELDFVEQSRLGDDPFSSSCGISIDGLAYVCKNPIERCGARELPRN